MREQEALPSAAPTIWPSLLKRGVGVPCAQGAVLCTWSCLQPTLQLGSSRSKCTSLEVWLPPLSPPGEGGTPASLPWFLSTLEGPWGWLQQMELESVIKPPRGIPGG